MLHKIFRSPKSTKTSPSERSKPRCPTCHNLLQIPPSLSKLQCSAKVDQIRLNTTVDRTNLLCKNCAYTTAMKTSTTVPSPQEIQTLQKSQQSKIDQALHLIAGCDLSDETKEKLRAAMPALAAKLQELIGYETRIRQWLAVKEENEKVLRLKIELREMGVQLEELDDVLQANVERMGEFEDEVNRKGWTPHWAVWGWDDENS